MASFHTHSHALADGRAPPPPVGRVLRADPAEQEAGSGGGGGVGGLGVCGGGAPAPSSLWAPPLPRPPPPPAPGCSPRGSTQWVIIHLSAQADLLLQPP